VASVAAALDQASAAFPSLPMQASAIQVSSAAAAMVAAVADLVVDAIVTMTTTTTTTMTNTARRLVTRTRLTTRKITRPALHTEPITKNCFKICKQMLCNNYRFYYSLAFNFISGMLFNN